MGDVESSTDTKNEMGRTHVGWLREQKLDKTGDDIRIQIGENSQVSGSLN